MLHGAACEITAEADTETDPEATMSLDDMQDWRVTPEFVAPESVAPSLLDTECGSAMERVFACEDGARVMNIAEPISSPAAPTVSRSLPANLLPLWNISDSRARMLSVGEGLLEAGLAAVVTWHWSPTL